MTMASIHVVAKSGNKILGRDTIPIEDLDTFLTSPALYVAASRSRHAMKVRVTLVTDDSTPTEDSMHDDVTFPLTYVEREDNYSVYQDATGKEVFLLHGAEGFTFLVDFDELNLPELWRDKRHHLSQDGFFTYLRGILTDPDVVDDLRWCTNCSAISHLDDGHSVEGEAFACDSCFGEYCFCARCEEWCMETNGTLYYDERVCESCCDDHYSWCEDCDGYYRDADAGEHNHEPEIQGMCCTSPEVNFVVRNDGQPLLANDTRITVTLPAGTIDAEGQTRIVRYLECENKYEIAHLVHGLGEKWQTKDGNFTKRLSKAAHQKRKDCEEQIATALATGRADHVSYYREQIERMRLTAAHMSMVGTIAGEHTKAIDFSVEVTRHFNMPAADFAHADSCWWQSYYASRCALKTNGGFALRTFDPYGDVTGRAWVMPLKVVPTASSARVLPAPTLVPTFETEQPDAFVVFNGYRKLDGYTPARIVAHMAGMTYRKIAFRCAPMFVNNDSGYLIAPEDIATHYTDGSLYLEVDQHSSLFTTENPVKELSHVA